MGISVIPAPSAASKTMYRTTLLSGTSYTVPAGVTYLNVTLVGAGGGGTGGIFNNSVPVVPQPGLGGQIIHSTLSVTAGQSIAYAIGAGGTNSGSGGDGGAGGTTTFTGATSASGGGGANRISNSTNYSNTGSSGLVSSNYGNSQVSASGSVTGYGGVGGAGCIIIEYWV